MDLNFLFVFSFVDNKLVSYGLDIYIYIYIYIY